MEPASASEWNSSSSRCSEPELSSAVAVASERECISVVSDISRHQHIQVAESAGLTGISSASLSRVFHPFGEQSRPVAQMKRKAFDAGLPWELSPGYVFRMRIEICDRLTGYEPVIVDVQLRCGDIVDNAKYLVSLRLYEQFGIFPKLSTFQLVQNGRRLSFTAPVTTADTLSIVRFVQTA